MKLRCRCCSGKLGLGMKTTVLWSALEWGYRRYHFCSQKCIDNFMQERQAAIDRRRAVAELYKPP